MNPHLQRWLTGLIAVPLVLFIVYSSDKAFALFIFIIIQLALWEYNRLAFGAEGYAPEKAEVCIFAAAIVFSAYAGDFLLMTSVLTFCLLTSFLIFLLRVKDKNIDLRGMEKVVLGFLYLPFLISFFILLRNLSHGVQWVLLAMVIAFCGDVFGYYIGRYWGSRKLHVYISPGKTLEGTLGLIAGSVLGALLFQIFLFAELPLLHALIMGACGGIMGQLGDLFESAMKRAAGVKDAGFLVPGHGGMMDRLDSLSFIAPFIFYYQQLVLR